jgi:hypothetical protein
MELQDLNPLAEFADPDPAATAAADKAKADAEAEKAELAATVKAQGESVTTLTKELGGLRDKAAVLDKLQEVLGAKPANPEEEFVTKEIRRRLGGDLEDLAKIKALLPQLLEIVGSVAEDKQSERVSAAQASLSAEMTKIGLDPEDEDTFKAMEDSVTSMIQRDEKLLAEWNKGQYKQAVSKAFDRLQAKLYAPLRSKMKSAAVRTLNDTPRSVPRGGPAASPGGKGSDVDTRDTSRDGIKKVHDAAYDRFTELLEK